MYRLGTPPLAPSVRWFGGLAGLQRPPNHKTTLGGAADRVHTSREFEMDDDSGVWKSWRGRRGKASVEWNAKKIWGGGEAKI